MTLRIGVLISGRGSNLAAILEAERAGHLPTSTSVVISNVKGAKGLEHAKKANVKTVELDHKAFPSRETFDGELVKALQEHGVTWVVLAGFMRLITPTLLRAFPDRIVNIHPSILPAFPGVRSQQQALHYGVKQTGCTVHLVDEGTDTGPILAQAALAVRDDDTEESLSARLLDVEHRLLVDTLRAIVNKGFRLEPSHGRRRVVWNE